MTGRPDKHANTQRIDVAGARFGNRGRECRVPFEDSRPEERLMRAPPVYLLPKEPRQYRPHHKQELENRTQV